MEMYKNFEINKNEFGYYEAVNTIDRDANIITGKSKEVVKTEIDELYFFRVEYLKTQDNDGDDCVIPTVWLGNQGFDLTRQYEDMPLSAMGKAKWFTSMFKKAIDNYAEYQNNKVMNRNKELVDACKKMIDYYDNGKIVSGISCIERVLESVEHQNKG